MKAVTEKKRMPPKQARLRRARQLRRKKRICRVVVCAFISTLLWGGFLVKEAKHQKYLASLPAMSRVYVEHTVGTDDSLWTIGKRYYHEQEGMSFGEYLGIIKEYNHLVRFDKNWNCIVQLGKRLVIPTMIPKEEYEDLLSESGNCPSSAQVSSIYRGCKNGY